MNTDKLEFLGLPVEIRLNIYSQLFGTGIAHVQGGRQDAGAAPAAPEMFPNSPEMIQSPDRSSQLLRTCKAILIEARPVLYKNTTFRSSFQAFAGRLPVQTASESLIFRHVRNLEWNLACDLLKVHKSEDVIITPESVRNLHSIQIACQAESWRGSFCGEWCDRELFVSGRSQVVEFAKLLQLRMAETGKRTTLIEDTRGLSRGRVVLRLMLGRKDAVLGVSGIRGCHQKNRLTK